MDHSQHEQYRADAEWEVRQLRSELEAVRKGEEYIRPPRYTTVTQKGCSVIPKDKLVKDLLSSLNNLLAPTEKKEWVGLTNDEIKAFDTWHDNREEEVGWVNPSEIVAHIEAKLKEKNK